MLMKNPTTNGFQSVKLRPNVSLIETMRRCHACEGTRVLSISWTKPVPPPKMKLEDLEDEYFVKPKGKEGYWNLNFIGEKPNLFGLEQLAL